ncbi:MAG: DUF3160 domain-containing protein [Spirochaetales bacterium]|nr:DUF3160 domain-containing protein [Spirochaetales bacterium]
MKRKIIVLSLFVVLALFSCNKEKEGSDLEDSSTLVVDSSTLVADSNSDIDAIAVEEKPEFKRRDYSITEFDTAELIKINFSDLNVKDKVGAPRAHAKYLDDPLTFFDINVESGRTAVVASNQCKFFEMSSGQIPEDVIYSKGEPIPLGTVIPLFDRYEAQDREYYGMFYYEGHYNYFRGTEWNGKSGIVFGADLRTDTSEKNEISSQYYKSNGKFDNFPPFHGYTSLSEDFQKLLKRDKLIFQEVNKNEYSLSFENPDDMVALYKKEVSDEQVPLFITTDLYSHAMHLFFNQYLQRTEEKFFHPRLKALTYLYLKEIEALEAKAIESQNASDAYLETLSLAKTYFLIPLALADLEPEIVETKVSQWSDDVVERSVPVDKASVLANYPESVVREIELILAAEGFKDSPNFLYTEDYSQFKPRGHYTRSESLSTYFKMMIWYGRLHFYITSEKCSSLEELMTMIEKNPALQLSIKLTPVAMLIEDITLKNKNLYDMWTQLFDPITELIGMSDDLSIKDLEPLAKRFSKVPFEQWVSEQKNIVKLIDEATKTLRSPLISGNTVMFNAVTVVDENGKPTQPMGWRLFGQRFTWDSYIHQRVSPPRLKSRDFVLGLDIMKVFGSDTADQLLRKSEYEMEGLEDSLNKLQEEFKSMEPDIWTETYYNRVLYKIKTLAEFESGSGFYFTQSPSWGIKAMISSHGTWAALRHDTILYVKQVYAERAGGEDLEPTFRTLPVPIPTHYIEPNVPFFVGLRDSVKHLAEISNQFGLNDKDFNSKIEMWIKLIDQSLSIVVAEYDDVPISSNSNSWITTIPSTIANLVVPPEVNYASYSDSQDQFRCAIIADVFTNSEHKLVLETGIGIPYRIYVPVNDGQGGKRIAIGYTFSYYEFLHPMNDRLTDEQWKAKVYSDEPDLSKYLPFWANNITVPAR